MVYLYDLKILFQDKRYKSKGSLLFKDRILLIIDSLPEYKESRYWNEKTIHEMEFSTVAIYITKSIIEFYL
ncbi:hypothetical protein BCR36DRAFT_456968 [Piromyces finnis]|uniref:Uncharacterized protein n=1 Tax=Piromyces finnis TaxID=1754191 RepID=A0A1Y1VJT0_9FUNG|nr:hypothetical protein BCR36DRAFT_456968 [Piromyces finnis]|eukprot:ORX58353.1 hypothetical protein BCR36DRAFT_456968 [Piromyces finnis]